MEKGDNIIVGWDHMNEGWRDRKGYEIFRDVAKVCEVVAKRGCG